MPAARRDLLTLAIETSNPSSSDDPSRAAGVCIGRIAPPPCAPTLITTEWLPPTTTAPGQDDTLFPAIDRALRRAAVEPRDLDRIAVSVGPGGYTGVRVACAAANMLCEGIRARQSDWSEHDRCLCIAVPTHLAAAFAFTGATGLPSGLRASQLRVILASKKDSAWISSPIPLYLLEPGAASSLDHLAIAHGEVITAATAPAHPDPSKAAIILHDRFLPRSLQEALATAGWVMHPLRLTPEAVLAAASCLGARDPAALNPLYPREPDAVTLWRARTLPQPPPV